MQDKFEYKLDSFLMNENSSYNYIKQLEDKLNSQGREGWELVGFELRATKLLYILKRKLPPHIEI